MVKKETVTFENIKADLNKIADIGFESIKEWRFTFIFPLTMASLLLGIASYIAFKNILAGIILFFIPLYHLVRFFISYKEYKIRKKAIARVSKREDISISLECLSHVSTEQIYEPYMGFRRVHYMKEVNFLNFRSFKRWRVGTIGTLYEWSEEHYMSGDTVEKTSMPEDEIFFVSLQGFDEIACVYPCKFFVLDKNLIK